MTLALAVVLIVGIPDKLGELLIPRFRRAIINWGPCYTARIGLTVFITLDIKRRSCFINIRS